MCETCGCGDESEKLKSLDGYVDQFEYRGRRRTTEDMDGIFLSTIIIFKREDGVIYADHFYGRLDVRLGEKVKLVYDISDGDIGSGKEVLTLIEFENRPPIRMI